MDVVLTNLGLIVTAIAGFISTIADTIIANPILFLGVGVGLTMTTIGIFKKFVR